MDIGKLHNLEGTVVLELEGRDLGKSFLASPVDDLSIPVRDIFLWTVVKRSQVPSVRDWVASKFNSYIIQYVFAVTKSASSIVNIDIAVLESNACINRLSWHTIILIILLLAPQTEVEAGDRAFSWHRFVEEIKVSFEGASQDGAIDACP